MKIKQPNRRENPENIVPLINIVFLLLIFFMLTARLSPQDPFELRVPSSSAATTEEKQVEGVLYLSKDSELVYNQQTVNQAELIKLLPQSHFGVQGLPLKFKADAQAPVSDLVAIMGALKKSGAKEIKLMTIRTE